MTELINAVKELAKKEYHDRLTEHGEFVDFHHAYGVIAEEVTEALIETDELKKDLQCYFNFVRADDYENALEFVSAIYSDAVCGAAELIQVAAMCEKAKKSLGGKYEQRADNGKIG